MKLRAILGTGKVWAGIVAGALLLTGCHFGSQQEFSEVPGLTDTAENTTGTGSTSATASSNSSGETTAAATSTGRTNYSAELMEPGETIQVSFSDLSSPIAPMEQSIRDDGTITLLYNQTFHAAGKTTGQLAKEIRQRYVPAYFINLTVTVAHQSQTRFYYVGGEVKAPGRQIWIGPITVTRAIQSAGDFTDFANRKRVKLVHSDGRSQTVNCVRALQQPDTDPQVYPGDKITVPRKLF